MLNITINEAEERIQNLIQSGNGDIGRLNFILESLRNNKPLYNSDQSYLETRLKMKFAIIQPEPEKTKT